MNTAGLTAAIVVGLFGAGHHAGAPRARPVGAPPAPPPQPPAAQTPPPRPVPPTRDPHTPGYVQAKELPDGEVPPAGAEGNFIIGPTHNPAPEMTVTDGVPQGTIHTLTMNS